MTQSVNVADLMAGIMSLSVPERILIAQDIWDSVAADQETVPPLTQAQRDELDRRIALSDADPDAGETWEELNARLQKRK